MNATMTSTKDDFDTMLNHLLVQLMLYRVIEISCSSRVPIKMVCRDTVKQVQKECGQVNLPHVVEQLTSYCPCNDAEQEAKHYMLQYLQLFSNNN